MDVNEVTDTTEVKQETDAKTATATLLYPSTYRMKGAKFEKGVRTNVSLPVAAYLMALENFYVDLNGASMAEVQESISVSREERRKPEDGDQVMRDIQRMADLLDPETESNFLKDGRPDARALSRMLGYTVTAEERDEALGYDDEDGGDQRAAGYATRKKAPETDAKDRQEAKKLRIARSEGVKL